MSFIIIVVSSTFEALFFVTIAGFVTRKAMLLTCKAIFAVRFSVLHINDATIFVGKALLSIGGVAFATGEAWQLAGKEMLPVRSTP